MMNLNMASATANPASGDTQTIEGVSLKLGRRVRAWQVVKLKELHREKGWKCEEKGSVLWFFKPASDPKLELYRVVDTRNSRVLTFNRFAVLKDQELQEKREQK